MRWRSSTNSEVQVDSRLRRSRSRNREVQPALQVEANSRGTELCRRGGRVGDGVEVQVQVRQPQDGVERTRYSVLRTP